MKYTPEVQIQYFKLSLNFNSELKSIKSRFENTTILKRKTHLILEDWYFFPVIRMKKQLSWHLLIILSNPTNSWCSFGKSLILCGVRETTPVLRIYNLHASFKCTEVRLLK